MTAQETQAVQQIVDYSRELGDGVDWVIGGGGNTSIKVGRTLFVKASGTTLASIEPRQFVAMDRDRLDAIWSADYPSEADLREEQALADLLAARLEGENAPRPSVETLMHALFPQRLVVHTHPTLVNGVTCSTDGEHQVREIFGEEAIWIETVNPGYTLARYIADKVERWREAHSGAWPKVLVMQNHGLTVAGEQREDIDRVHRSAVRAIADRLERLPEMEAITPEGPTGSEATLCEVVTGSIRADGGSPVSCIPFCNRELLRRASDRDSFAAIASAFTPDHIVYSGHRPCFCESRSDLAPALNAYREQEGVPPKIIVVAGEGAVAVGATERKAELARLLFLDTLKIACYSESFGGQAFMPDDQIEFIRGWEVEKFREAQSTGGS